MPGFTTHYILGIKCYNELPDGRLKTVISDNYRLFRLGLQGPDIFFYHIPSVFHRDFRNVGSYMHEHGTNNFFANALSAAANLKSPAEQAEAVSYIAGFLCHYACDSICHPFVYGRIRYVPNVKKSQNHGKHAALENDIDTLFLMKYKGRKPSQFSQSEAADINGFESGFLSVFLSGVINRTYYPINESNNFQVTPGMIRRTLFSMRFGNRVLSDPTGRKKRRLGKVESLFMKEPLVTARIVTDSEPDPVKCLNLNHETWYNPWDNRLASDQSFPELFNQALVKCHTLFYLLDLELADPKQMKVHDFHRLLTELGNCSYHSGLRII